MLWRSLRTGRVYAGLMWGDVIPPPGPGSTPSSPPSWTCHECRHPGGILIRCPNHLNWLLSIQRSSGPTQSPSWMAELLTLSLKETPATLRRKPILAACTCDLVFLGEGRDEDWPVDRLCLPAQLPFSHNRAVKNMQCRMLHPQT